MTKINAIKIKIASTLIICDVPAPEDGKAPLTA
jgi:hypothetical protein